MEESSTEIFYPKKQLDTWKTGRLGSLYMNMFTMVGDDYEDNSQLKIITDILKDRPLAETRPIKNFIRTQMRRTSDGEESMKYTNMINYFIANVYMN